MTYFSKTWVENNSNWFEGFAPFVPSTNNAVESFNNQIKSNFIFRERPALNIFKVKMIDLVHMHSCEYRDDIKVYKSDITPDKDMWKKSLHWATWAKTAIIKADDENESTMYYVRAGEQPIITESVIKKQFSGKNFDDYMNNLALVRKIVMPNNEFDFWKSTCTCAKFFKSYTCKHVVGMGIRLQRLTLPPYLQVVENGDKRGHGRPKKARLALNKT